MEEGPRRKRKREQQRGNDDDVLAVSSSPSDDLAEVVAGQQQLHPVVDKDRECAFVWERMNISPPRPVPEAEAGSEAEDVESSDGAESAHMPEAEAEPLPSQPPPPPSVPMPQPAEAENREQVPVAVPVPVPWDVLFPRRSTYRDAIVNFALPPLLNLLRDPNNRLKRPRDLVNQALEQCSDSGNCFWGKYETFTRKRSACDSILAHYFATLQDYAAGRPVAPI